MNEMMSETIELKSSEEIRAEATEAAAEVTRLEQEQRDVTAKLADPQIVFDPALSVELRQRLDELPLFINAARLRVAMLRVQMYDVEAQEHKAELEPLHQAMLEEQVRFESARALFENTVQAWRGARASIDVARMDANESRGRVRELQSEASKIGGAVVRRRPQAA